MALVHSKRSSSVEDCHYTQKTDMFSGRDACMIRSRHGAGLSYMMEDMARAGVGLLIKVS